MLAAITACVPHSTRQGIQALQAQAGANKCAKVLQQATEPVTAVVRQMRRFADKFKVLDCKARRFAINRWQPCKGCGGGLPLWCTARLRAPQCLQAFALQGLQRVAAVLRRCDVDAADQQLRQAQRRCGAASLSSPHSPLPEVFFFTWSQARGCSEGASPGQGCAAGVCMAPISRRPRPGPASAGAPRRQACCLQHSGATPIACPPRTASIGHPRCALRPSRQPAQPPLPATFSRSAGAPP